MTLPGCPVDLGSYENHGHIVLGAAGERFVFAAESVLRVLGSTNGTSWSSEAFPISGVSAVFSPTSCAGSPARSIRTPARCSECWSLVSRMAAVSIRVSTRSPTPLRNQAMSAATRGRSCPRVGRLHLLIALFGHAQLPPRSAHRFPAPAEPRPAEKVLRIIRDVSRSPARKSSVAACRSTQLSDPVIGGPGVPLSNIIDITSPLRPLGPL